MTSSSSRMPPSSPDLADTEWCSINPEEVLDYDADTEIYRASFDSRTERLDKTIVTVVAAVLETPPLELPSLEPVIDTDAVDRLITSVAADPSREDIHVSFMYANCDVTVHSYGIISVQPLHEDGPD